MEVASRTIINEEKLIYLLGGLNEGFDNVFSTLTKKMLTIKTTIDDANARLLSHWNRLEKRRSTIISPWPSVIVVARDEPMTKISLTIDDTIS